jgi:hypothetical protein
MSEYQPLINIIAGVAFSALGWFARELWSAVNDLKRDLSKLREELPKTYVTREDFKADVKEIKEMLGKIFDRLENKADKP